jgi:hypothetical protein
MRILLLFLVSFFVFDKAKAIHALPDSTTTDTSTFKTPTDNHHCYRYIFMQSGISLPAKTLYYHNFNFFMNDFQYGITNNLNVSAGVVLPLYFYVSPKYSVDVENNQRLLIGDIAITSAFLKEPHKAKMNVLYAGYSFGDDYDHFTVCMGYFTANFSPDASLMYNIGGSKKLTPTVYLIGELWFNQGNQKIANVSQWELDENGNKQLVDPSNPLASPYKTTTNNKIVNRTTLFANIQLRLISNKNDTKSWSFGLAYYSNFGGEYDVQNSDGTTQHLTNYFSFPVPSISFTQKIGKVEPKLRF